ncbi:alpha/beta hydrolase [Schaalia sp. ZJ1691]|uniref:alpha/beta fold hydrolase n=1 Tax=Schaalia sp. ZJ1691 TaxID=2709404 RepID=UPI0013E9DD7C|nr:alpha/beta hydrolase [Schaalia sp. ZJ1691]
MHPIEDFITAGGSRTAIYSYGTPGNPQIIAVHGFRGTHSGLEKLAARLGRLGFHVLVPDLPGCGASSELPVAHTIDAFADWLVSVTKTLRPTGAPPILLGHSLGSVIVTAAISRGLACSGAVLVNPIVTSMRQGPNALGVKFLSVYYGAARVLPASLSDVLLASRIYARISGHIMAQSDEPGMHRAVVDEHVRCADSFTSPRAAIESFDTSADAHILQFVDGLNLPVLVLGGDRDDLNPVEDQQLLVNDLPDASYRLVRGIGHLIPFEAADVAAEAVHRWFLTTQPVAVLSPRVLAR